ncbi:MAG: L-sorbosone dehydrogenase [Planctomycetota bacterium]
MLRSSVCAFLLSATLSAFSPLFRIDAAEPSSKSAQSDSGAKGLGITEASQFSVPDGFVVEVVHEVTEGSWVSLAASPDGSLLACDQYGSLYRTHLADAGAEVEKVVVQTDAGELQGAQGVLFAFGSLYVNVNSRDFPSGVWRLTDSNGDNQYEKAEHLIELNAAGEHGPHALILSHDGKRILMCAGNNTKLPEEIAQSRVPQVWDEDQLLTRMPDARGHNAKRLAPGGFVVSLDPNGKDIELIATGFRNQYDIALDKDGELFTYDADMEWDVGTPWYRPTRVNHVISGAEFGWRNGTGKWPADYPDSFGAAVDIGPGSPTGICFGYGTKFPAKYENALFIGDWSYGNIHAVTLEPDGSSYKGKYEVFATAAPLPVTDMVVNPNDGALYFAIGGRRTQSGLYRIRYEGDLSSGVKQVGDSKSALVAREVRHELEAYHQRLDNPQSAIEQAIKSLALNDRAIAYASRIALEHQPIALWRDQVLALTDDRAAILGIVAIARHGGADDRDEAIDRLAKIDFDALSEVDQVNYLRALGLVAIRLGGISNAQKQGLVEKLSSKFPAANDRVSQELARLLVYLEDSSATSRIVEAMASSDSQESQLHMAYVLREAKQGWTGESRKLFFEWFQNLQSARGGASFGGFVQNIKMAAFANIPSELQASIEPLLKVKENQTGPAKQRKLVQQWTTDGLLAAMDSSNAAGDAEAGRKIFAEASCLKCHRMGTDGGILGPDLTAAGGRFNRHDMIESIVDPSKVISDQYSATQFLTEDGDILTGRVVNMNGETLKVMTNMLDPSAQTAIERDAIMQTRPATTSMMPSGLLDTFSPEEIADLAAYLLSAR